jgi:hypothetical protein
VSRLALNLENSTVEVNVSGSVINVTSEPPLDPCEIDTTDFGDPEVVLRTISNISVTFPDAGDENISRLRILVEGDATVFLQGSPNLSRFHIDHPDALATINTTAKAVPNLTINPPVAKLRFWANGTECNCSSPDDCRTGPNLSATVTDWVTVGQRDFLSELTEFKGQAGETPFTFRYVAKASVNYTFNSTPVAFDTPDDTISFSEIALNRSMVSSNRSRNMKFSADHLISDVKSISAGFFTSFMISKSCVIEDTGIESITLTNESIQITLTGGRQTPVILQTEAAPFNVKTRTADLTIGVNRAVADRVLPNFALLCDGDSTIHLDVSFYQVENPSAVTIIIRNGTGNKITLESSLVNIPDITVQAEFGDVEVEVIRIPKQPIFTAELAFWAFIGLLGIIAVISVILCIAGNHCLPPEEKFDVSTDASEDNAQSHRESLVE